MVSPIDKDTAVMREEPLTQRQSSNSSFSGRTPDFIIGGAMKCGTSSLHEVLAQLPGIFIPKPEISFFDIDDALQHPDYSVYYQGSWKWVDFDQQMAEGAKWYCNFFNPAGSHQLVGEDSTGYLASDKAPGRIASLMPNVKLIFMLRNPTDRSYSHYWHSLRTGREMYSFEDSLQYTPSTIIQRSLYKSQILRYQELFPRSQIKFVMFEEFVKNMPRIVTEVCEFLGADVPEDVEKVNSHANQSRLPRSIPWRLWENRVFRVAAGRLYLERVQGGDPGPEFVESNQSLWCRTAKRVLRIINPLTPKRPPPMKAETRRFLDDLFKRENRGLSELIDIDVDRWWSKSSR